MNNNAIKQVPIMNNYITVLIETLHKTSNMKGHITTAHRANEFQRTVLIQITETEMIMIVMAQGHGMEDY